jgi:hypothetical protein
MHVGYWWESQMERDHWEDQGADGWTILKLILERQDGITRVEAGSNTSTVTLRVVRGDEMELKKAAP